MKVLYIGESWLGSCARSIKEALARQPGIVLDEVNEDLFFPIAHREKWLRGIHQVLRPSYRREFYRETLKKIRIINPDCIIAYKGWHLGADFLRAIKALAIPTINIYPDYSPHAYGRAHKEAVGVYDMIISSKPFHPRLWQSTYGYSNTCLYVPQGYEPALHLVDSPESNQPFDITMVATWRPEYGELMKRLGKLLDKKNIKVGIGGNGWSEHRSDYPDNWVFAGALHGRAYIDWLRSGKICLAPVTRDVRIGDAQQPGDEDTTRTYELAAAHCFFIHRRTDLVQTLYDETTEVPMYDSADELAEKILHYLPRSKERLRLARNAHQRAVPAYSLDARAADICQIISELKPDNIH